MPSSAGDGHARVAAAVAVGGATVAIFGVLALTLVSLVDQADEVGDTATSGAEQINEAAGGLLGIGTDAIRGGHRFRRAGHPGRLERDGRARGRH